MPFCEKCGRKVPDDAQYCPYCGINLDKTATERFTVKSDDLVKRIKELLHEGNVRRITVKNEEEKVLLDIPVTAGIIGVLVAPWLAAVGVIAAMASKCTIEIERKEGETTGGREGSP